MRSRLPAPAETRTRSDSRHPVARKWRLLIAGAAGAAAVVVAGGVVPARAAQADRALSAPYQMDSHNTSMTCSGRDVVPTCSGSSSSNHRNGTMTVAAAVDSGAGGTLPGQPESEAIATLSSTFDMGEATAATFTFNLHVNRYEQAERGSGRSGALVWASANCDSCADPNESFGFPDGPSDQAVTVTLVRGTAGGRTADLSVQTSAGAMVECDDFCVAPSGKASASAQVVLTSIDVKLWGVGQPDTPGIADPASQSTVHSSDYQTQCDTQCVTFSGEQVTGTAEPGMPIDLTEGGRLLTQTQADDTGEWTAYVALPAGSHTLTATANNQRGSSTSAPRTFTVTG